MSLAKQGTGIGPIALDDLLVKVELKRAEVSYAELAQRPERAWLGRNGSFDNGKAQSRDVRSYVFSGDDEGD
jgi:hypothetical protein